MNIQIRIDTFEDFLKDAHAGEYIGTDDDMPEAFDEFLSELSADDFIKYGNEYGLFVINQLMKSTCKTQS